MFNKCIFYKTNFWFLIIMHTQTHIHIYTHTYIISLFFHIVFIDLVLFMRCKLKYEINVTLDIIFYSNITYILLCIYNNYKDYTNILYTFYY